MPQGHGTDEAGAHHSRLAEGGRALPIRGASDGGPDPLAEIADSLGLVCFDPQIEQMLPDATATPASTITTHAHEAVARHLEEAQRTDSST